MDSIGEFFTYNSTYQFWICKTCQYVVDARSIVSHLASKHRRHPSACTGVQRAAIHAEAVKVEIWNPDTEPFIPPSPKSRPIPELPVHRGYRCPVENCQYTGRTVRTMRSHRGEAHRVTAARRGRPRTNQEKDPLMSLDLVYCQRLAPYGAHSSYFVVTPDPAELPNPQTPASEINEAAFIQAQVDFALLRSDGIADAEDKIAPAENDETEASLWLQLTRWPEYIRGHAFSDIAKLAILPDPATEPILVAMGHSVKRLINQSFESISSHRINEFDQVRINSFVQKPGIWERPIQIKLQPKTYTSYCQVWVRLLSFAYRTGQPNQPIQLRHQFTISQLSAIDSIYSSAQRLIQVADSDSMQETSIPPALQPSDRTQTPASQAMKNLDQACLDLSIALLDHEIRGDLFESPVVAFMAALGIDSKNQTYHEPGSYTTHLSALVKISQMLVTQRAVDLADRHQVQHPGDALEEMQARFLMYGVRYPFSWIVRLRTYGKKVQNTSTSLGSLIWSGDQQSLQYRDLQLTMDSLANFIRSQVKLTQFELERVFLLDDGESRADMIPELPLHQLTDDPVNNQRGWSFLKHRKNRQLLSTPGERWMLDRIMTTESLRKDFINVQPAIWPEHDISIKWNTGLLRAYLGWVDEFLRRLLLLVHMTSGQPARATELISIRYCNTPEGRHRNIFIEHGLVCFVTSYHKSQSTTNSIKIIHRYLPREVSELVVYYLWLIQPFTEQADMFARQSDSRIRSAFFWPKMRGHWDAARLGVIMKSQGEEHLQTKLNVLNWRHAAIGISRVHLKCGGFKRDYGPDDPVVDEQAAHGSWTAGTVYARGLQEAPGVIEAKRIRYRAISSEWHKLLGFDEPRCPKRRYSQLGDSDNALSARKRHREYIHIDYSENEC